MIKFFGAQLILGLGMPALLFAETITLKSGKTIEGKIIEETDQYIKIDVEGQPIYYERKYIASPVEEKGSSQEIPLITDDEYLKEALRWGSEGRFEKAQDLIKKGLLLNPNNHNLREVQKLIDELRSGIIQENYALHMFKGSRYLMEHQFKESILEFKSALEINPHPDLFYYLGVCYYSLHEYAQAIDYLKKAAAEIKDDNEIYYNLGISHYALRQYPQAVEYLKKALAINPQDADSYGVLGTCHLILGQKQLAKEELSKSIKLFREQGDYLKAADVETFLKQIN